MNIKELSNLYYIKKEIERLEEELDEITEIGSSVIDGMPHNSNSSDKVQQLVIKKQDLMSKIIKKQIAKENGVNDNEIDHIIGDLENIEEAGESAKYEKDNMCTIVTKLYKKNKKVFFAQATRYVDLKKEKNTGLTYYPVAHLLWEEKIMEITMETIMEEETTEEEDMIVNIEVMNT